MSKFVRNEDAFTGLEAAIVLIAFVVVAAVFSYVVLGAGFFTTQKSQEVIHTGVSQTSSSIEIVGDVIGKAGTSMANLESVLVTVGLSAGQGSVDFDNVVVTYSDANVVKTLTHDDDNDYSGSGDHSDADPDNWIIYDRQNSEDDIGNLLEPFEQFTLSIGIPADATVGPNHPFTIEIKPSVGAPYGIVRTTPPQFTAFNTLR